MITKLALSLFAAVVFVGLTATGTIQAQEKQEKQESTHQKTRTVKGCLAKESGNEHALTGADGSTWEVKSDSVDLAQHVGHEVSVTGVVSNAAAHGAKEDTKNEAKEHGVDKNATEHGHLTATNVKIVSESCQK